MLSSALRAPCSFNITRLPYPSRSVLLNLILSTGLFVIQKKYGTSGVAREAQNHPPSRVPLFRKADDGPLHLQNPTAFWNTPRRHAFLVSGPCPLLFSDLTPANCKAPTTHGSDRFGYSSCIGKACGLSPIAPNVKVPLNPNPSPAAVRICHVQVHRCPTQDSRSLLPAVQGCPQSMEPTIRDSESPLIFQTMGSPGRTLRAPHREIHQACDGIDSAS